jgi:FKBP-type peptidyl-prolyl cis-trans isomerase
MPALVFVLASCGKADKSHWTLPSGVKVTEVAEGSGLAPKKGDILKVTFTASFVKGGKEITRYDDPKEPYEFRVGMGDVLPGFDEGVATMRPGGKRILVLPPKAAFGEDGLTGTVPPHSWVKIEVSLLEIVPRMLGPKPWDDAGMDLHDTPSGLQYIDYEIGDGPVPTPTSTVVVDYTGFLDDGTMFDTTYFTGRPLEFNLSNADLIPGWLEGLATMHAGGRRKLIIPPYLAYGKKGYRKVVPPNATLVYDVVLLEVK